MAKNFIEEYKDKFSFLSDYGFVLTVDPHNPNKPCFKNYFGEIVFGLKNDNGMVCQYELYVQIDGWKHEIDVKSEYKRYIKKSTLFKPYEVMVKELFEFMVRTTKQFYGLKIVKNNFKPYSISEYEPVDISYMNENTFARKRRSNLVVTMFVSCFILCFLQLILLGLFHSVKSYETVFILKNILCVSVLMVNLLIILMLKNNLNIISYAYIPTKHTYIDNDSSFNDFEKLKPLIEKFNNPRGVKIKRYFKNPLANFRMLKRSQSNIKITKLYEYSVI